jgi:hypothetical protein
MSDQPLTPEEQAIIDQRIHGLKAAHSALPKGRRRHRYCDSCDELRALVKLDATRAALAQVTVQAEAERNRANLYMAAHAEQVDRAEQAEQRAIAAELDATVARQAEAHAMAAYRSARKDVEQAEQVLAQATTQTCETCKFKGTAGGNLDVNWCALWKQTVPDQVTGCKGYQALPAPPKLTTQGEK